MDKSGDTTRVIDIPKAKALSGIAYCEEKDVYVVGDTRNSYLWKIDAEKGVAKSMGKKGTGHKIQSPWYVSHLHTATGECFIFASDRFSNCIHMFTIDGSYVRQLGCGGMGDGQLDQPFSVCSDTLGEVFVCDGGNHRLVSYRWDGGEGWGTVVSREGLEGRTPNHADYQTP